LHYRHLVWFLGACASDLVSDDYVIISNGFAPLVIKQPHMYRFPLLLALAACSIILLEVYLIHVSLSRLQ
jgi:hypothetical protein